MKYVLMFSLIYSTCVSLAFSENLLGRYFPVYVNSETVSHQNGIVYHFYKCDLLTSSKEMYFISEVIEKGMGPCEVCQPPNKYDPENYTKVKLPQSSSKSSDSDITAQYKNLGLNETINLAEKNLKRLDNELYLIGLEVCLHYPQYSFERTQCNSSHGLPLGY